MELVLDTTGLFSCRELLHCFLLDGFVLRLYMFGIVVSAFS